MLNIRVDGNWGLKLQQSFTVDGNIQYNLIHRYNTVDYNALTFKGANVGIGTASPQRPLHVHASMRIGGTGILDFGDDSTTQIYRDNSTGLGQVRIVSNNNTCITAHNGYVGIGNITPGYMLDVNQGFGWPGNISTSYIGYNTGVNNTTNNLYSYSISLRVYGSIWCTSYFVTSSDIRIKEDIQDINDDTALQMILSIEPKTYKYIDKIGRPNSKVYGFIAQQIKEVIPEAITIEKSYIPNIYLVADYIDCVITLSSQPTKVVIKMNDKIKCYDKDNKEILVEVIEVIDYLTFRIKEIEYTDTKIFVYGTFVDDFHTLNKDYIFTLNVCATQELHRRIEAQSVVIKSYEDRIKDLETKVAMLLNSNA